MNVAVTTVSYVYGWAASQQYERQTDIGLLQNSGVGCSTDTVCSNEMTAAINNIYQQSFSSPTVLLGF